ncbi:hypothetical protein WJX72_004308 [[Myrmecia] bisecta]|uniref:Uncharacterized protein n=1 Tax=[Myrmecia] bisecta TaxID=41462 RepID=A0AAW1Q205_9CHLO
MAAQPGADLPFQVDGSDEFVKKHLGDLQAAQGLAVCHGVLEKATRVLGLMAATWATVILLGGFAATLEVQDFYVGLPCRTCVESSFFNRLDQEAPQAHLTEIDLSGLHPALRSAFELARDNASLPWKPADVLTLRFGLNKPL